MQRILEGGWDRVGRFYSLQTGRQWIPEGWSNETESLITNRLSYRAQIVFRNALGRLLPCMHVKRATHVSSHNCVFQRISPCQTLCFSYVQTVDSLVELTSWTLCAKSSWKLKKKKKKLVCHTMTFSMGNRGVPLVSSVPVVVVLTEESQIHG